MKNDFPLSRVMVTLLVICTGSLTFAQESNRIDENGRKQGPWMKYHPGDSVIRYTGQFKDDVPVGTFKHYAPTKDLLSVIDHKPNGVAYAEHFYPDGTIKGKGKFVKHQKDSTWLYFNPGSQLVSEEFYIEGRRFQTWRVFYPNGNPAEETTWENDLEHGQHKRYFENGMVLFEGNYNQGSLEGEAIYYHPNGVRRFQGVYVRDAKHGEWTTYDEEGNELEKRKFMMGVSMDEDEQLIIEDSSGYFIKERYDENDVMGEEALEIPTKKEERKQKKRK